jgi:hypothetical protein
VSVQLECGRSVRRADRSGGVLRSTQRFFEVALRVGFLKQAQLPLTFVFADVPGLRSAAKLASAEPRVREGVRKRKRIYEERHLGQQ